MIPEIHRAAAPVVQRFALTLAAACLVLLLPAASFGETAPQKEKPSELRGEPIGANQALAIIPDLDEATRTADGLGVWTHSVSMEGAAFLRPRFADFDLRPGDSLIVRSASGRVVETLRGQGPKDRRSFWGLSAFGSELHLELRFRGVYRQAPFRITDVIVGDPAMLESVTAVPGAPAPPAQKSICAPADFEDVVCYDSDTPKWANIFASAGVATADTGAGALWCSGANVSPLNYVLTNHHCIGSQSECDNAEFIFKYYRTGCNDGSPTTQDWVSYRCDEMVAFSPWNNQCDSPIDELDFSLHSVMGDPATDFGFVTPDPTPLNNGEGIYIVQHPSGRPHEIAHGSGANVEIDTGGGALSVLRYYDTLDTEGGSSGSPVFRESDDLMVGLHHCGGCSTAGVGNRGMLMSDIYPIIESFLCQPMLSLSSGAAGDITEVSGNGDAVLDPGETWQFIPSVRNGSCDAAASNVQATFAAGAGSVDITLLQTTSTFGSVAATESAAGTPVQFQIGSQIDCAGEVVIDMVNVTSSSGGPFSGRDGYAQAEIGSIPTTTLLFEDFATGLPATWVVVDNGTGTGAAQTWTDANPGNRDLLNAPFVIADSDNHGTGNDMDEELITPPVDTTAASSVTLQFNHHFRWYNQGGDEQGDVDVRSSATGGTWVNVHNYSGGDSQGQQSFDLTAYSAADLQVRFHYYNANFDWWWAIDDIYFLEVGERQCAFSASIFEDDFESGDTSAWSVSSP